MPDDSLELCVWVVGGGLAGLSTAAALVRLGNVARVEVLEDMEANVYHEAAGAAIQLGPNGLLALQRIGGDDFVQKIIENGDTITGIGVVKGGGGLVTLAPDESVIDTGMPQVLIQWSVLKKHLLELVPMESIHTSVRIGGYRHAENGKILVDQEGASPISLDPAIPPPTFVVAADGCHSRLRNALEQHQDSEQPFLQDNRRINIKAVVQKRLDYEAYGFRDQLGNELPKGTVLAHYAPSLSCFAGSAGLDHTYWAVSIADHENGDRTISEDDNLADTKEKLLAIIVALSTDTCQFILDLIQASPAESIYVQRSRQLKRLTPSFLSPDGSLVAVGDAAHAMSPAYGQSANFCFEDAATLGICLGGSTTNIHDALRLYSRARKSRCEEMLQRSAERATKVAKGESKEAFRWISAWKPPVFH